MEFETRAIHGGQEPDPATGARTDVSREPLDLRHDGLERSVGAYLVETPDGLALFDCGPATTFETLREELHARGVEFADLRHLLLSHIHLDHAGAAGLVARANPALTVHVSAIGAPHVVDPSRLEASARRLYGETFDTLFGALIPVPEERVHIVSDRVAGLDCFPTPGHAAHHVSYLHPDGTLYAGDAAGVRVAPARFVLPPLPPPEVDLDAWRETFAAIRARRPERLACIHFGVFADVEAHLDRLEATIARWSGWVAGGADEAKFAVAAHADIAASDPESADHYLSVVPSWHAFRGLDRYHRKLREAVAAAP